MTTDMKTEVPAGIVEQLTACWFPRQDAAPNGLGSIDRAVNALRATVAEGPPYVLGIHDFVMLACYFDPGNRAILAPLLTPEVAAAADALADTTLRLIDIKGAGFDDAATVAIAIAEDGLRHTLAELTERA